MQQSQPDFSEAERACGEALRQNVIRLEEARHVGRPLRAGRTAPGVSVRTRIDPRLATALREMHADKVAVFEAGIRTLQMLADGNEHGIVDLWRSIAPT